jgi:hypothetical protein
MRKFLFLVALLAPLPAQAHVVAAAQPLPVMPGMNP